MPNLKIFENYPTGRVPVHNFTIPNHSMFLQHVYIPGDISFNKVGFIISGQTGSVDNSLTVSFGLYSLNGATLSLANSASGSTTASAGFLSWFTSLATSATQNITEGEWWLAVIKRDSGDNHIMLRIPDTINASGYSNSAMQGPFYKGFYSASASSMLGSIATSDCENLYVTSGSASNRQPYIIISA